MANPNFGGNNFSPQGAKQVSVIGQRPQLSGGSLQGQGTVALAPAFNAQPTVAPEAPSAPAQAQINPMNTPRGAQPVALAGQQPQQAAMPVPPAQQPQYAPPQQIPHQAAHPSLGAGEEVHVILVRGLGRDNREYVAEFDAVFPVGTRILGVSERPPA